MGDGATRVLEAKLDILIDDFQRFKKGQELVNKELSDDFSEEKTDMAKILTTLRWHSTIGAGMATVIGYMFINTMGV